jgi:hypothetical protein
MKPPQYYYYYYTPLLPPSPPPPPKGKYYLGTPEKWSIIDPVVSSCKIEVPAIRVVLGYECGAKSRKTLMIVDS